MQVLDLFTEHYTKFTVRVIQIIFILVTHIWK